MHLDTYLCAIQLLSVKFLFPTEKWAGFKISGQRSELFIYLLVFTKALLLHLGEKWVQLEEQKRIVIRFTIWP
jgi:hypothetical protein